jgi:voltage-gated potassium channel Kch
VPPVEAASRGGRALARHGDRVALATVVSRSEVVASDLDLGRGELGPLERLGSLEALADPAKCAATGYRLVLRVSTTVALHGALDRETTTNANLLLRSSGGVLCLDAIEASVAPTGGEAFALRASFGAKPVARARLGGARVTCTVDPASAP